MTPLEDLLRTLAPPLEYIASAPLAPVVLPFRVLHEKIARTATATVDPRIIGALQEVGTLLARLDAVAGGTRAEGPNDGSGSAISAGDALRRLLELVGELRMAPPPEPLPAQPYRRTTGPIPAQLDALRTPVQFVKGVRPKRAEQLATLGLTTVDDLLFHLPFRYEDRREVRTISMLRPGEQATIEAELHGVQERFAGGGRRRILEATATDASGTLTLLWYHQLAVDRKLSGAFC